MSESSAHIDGVTIVVITRDGWSELQNSLSRHQAPVILIDNGSSDGTPDLVRRHFPEITLVELGRNHGAVARNIGAELAQTAVVAFADDDSWWEPGSLEAGLALFDSCPRLGLVAAQVLVGNDSRSDPICRLMADSPLPRLPDLPGPSILGFLACGALVRRSAFLAAGGFDDVIFFFGEEERLALDLAAQGWGARVRRQRGSAPPPAAFAEPRRPRRSGGAEQLPHRCAAPALDGGFSKRWTTGPRWAHRAEGSAGGAPAAAQGTAETSQDPGRGRTDASQAGDSLRRVGDHCGRDACGGEDRSSGEPSRSYANNRSTKARG